MGIHSFKPKGYRKNKGVPKESKRRRSKEKFAKFGTYARKKLHDTFRRKNKSNETLQGSQKNLRSGTLRKYSVDKDIFQESECLKVETRQDYGYRTFSYRQPVRQHEYRRKHYNHNDDYLMYADTGPQIIHSLNIFDDPLDCGTTEPESDLVMTQQQIYAEYPLPDPRDRNAGKRIDDEIDYTKEKMRKIKEESLTCTRNVLKLAQEAEGAGLRTMDLLGQQSNILKNVGEDLDRVGDYACVHKNNMNRLYGLKATKVVGNPFHPRRSQKSYFKDQKLSGGTVGLLDNDFAKIESNLDANNYYQTEERRRAEEDAILQQAAKYQFENDSFDDEIEVETCRNLDAAKNFSGRLRRMASSVAHEIEGQQEQIRQISTDMERATKKLCYNTKELERIRERSGSGFGRFTQLYL